jgi:hypothetical protein
MMRVIRTEEYFDPSAVRWDYKELMHGNPGIGFAFIEAPGGIPAHFDELDRFTANISSRADDIEIDEFLNAAIQTGDLTVMEQMFHLHARPARSRVGGRTARTSYKRSRPPPQPLVQDIRKLGIVIENSPPRLIDFDTLLKSAGPAVAIGTFVGLSAASHPILLLTVPGGIMGAAAAIALSKTIEDGLPKAVERWIRFGPLRRPTRPRAGRSPRGRPYSE